jgi:folate-binding protein YgfZ
MMRGVFNQAQAHAGARFLERDGWEIPGAFGEPAQGLRVLGEAAGLVDWTGYGVLRLAGADRLDFVQRLSTNDVQHLKPWEGAATVFANPVGRVIDLACVLVREEDLLLVVGRGAQNRVTDWLRGHVFFNDDVLVEPVTEQFGLAGLTGPGAEGVATQLFGDRARELAPFYGFAAQVNGTGVQVLRGVPLGNEYLIMIPAGDAGSVWASLARTVEPFDGAPVGERALDTWRVAQGIPRYGHELTEAYIPLEAGLKWAVSFNKGCYIGQEIIARMESRQRLAKRLVVLEYPTSEQHAGLHFISGDAVRADDAPVGEVTSVASLPDQGTIKALAYVKTAWAEPGQPLLVAGPGGPARVNVLAVAGEYEQTRE